MMFYWVIDKIGAINRATWIELSALKISRFYHVTFFIENTNLRLGYEKEKIGILKLLTFANFKVGGSVKEKK